jgi:hypothetical protein
VPFDCGISAIEAEDNLGGGAFPRNCNTWPCEICQPRKRVRLIFDIAAGHPNRFITMTLREGQFATPEIGAERLAWAWKIIVQRWRRLKPGNKCEFAVVREAQVNGQPHLHIAWSGDWIDWGWLRKQADELLNSPHVHIRFIYDPKRAARYIAKYLGKAPHRFGTGKRYWFSRNYRKEPRQARVSVFPSRLRFRESNRTMVEVRRWLKSLFIEYQEHNGGAITWNNKYEHPPPKPKREPAYWHFRSGIPHLRTKRGWSV